jgi:hypothetical protein
VYEQYNTSGNVLINKHRLHAFANSTSSFRPNLSVNASGEMLVLWEEIQNGQEDMVACRLSADGSVVTPPFIPHPESDENQALGYPVQFDSGGFAIAWSEGFGGELSSKIIFYDQDADPMCPVQDLRDITEGSFPTRLFLTANSDVAMALWEDWRDGQSVIYAQRFSDDGTRLGSNAVITEESGWYGGFPKATVFDLGFLIAWVENHDDESRVRFRAMNSEGSYLGESVTCIVGDPDYDITYISPGKVDDIEVALSWVEVNDYASQIKIALVDTAGTQLSPQYLLHQNSHRYTYRVSHAMINDRIAIVCWEEQSENGVRVVTRSIDLDSGEMTELFFPISQSNEYATAWPAIASTTTGAVLVWQDVEYPGSGWDIFLNRLNVFTGEALILSFPEITTASGRPVDFPLEVQLPENRSIQSFEVSISGFQEYFEFDGISIDSTLLNEDTWQLEYWYSDTLTVYGTALDSAGHIDTPGVLFNLELFVSDQLDSLSVPVLVHDVFINNSSQGIEVNNGSITISPTVHANAITRILTFELRQNYPNPFNPTTTISYGLPVASDVSLVVYDVTGREVNRLVQTTQHAGWYDVEWNGLDVSGMQVSTGLYFARIEAGGFNQVIKMVYLQ